MATTATRHYRSADCEYCQRYNHACGRDHAPAPRARKAGRHRLYDNAGREVTRATVHLDAFDGWVREVPGTLVPPAIWYRVESIATGETLR